VIDYFATPGYPHPTTRAAAKNAWLPRYFDGSPCKRGHVVPRYTSNGSCVQCQHEAKPVAVPKQRKTRRAPRAVAGVAPRATDKPMLLGVLAGFPCPFVGYDWPETWHLWLRAASSPRAGWWNLKLCAAAPDGKPGIGVVRSKANYWLSWHAQKQRFSVTADRGKLRDGRPELYEAVISLILNTIGLSVGENGQALRGSLTEINPLYIQEGVIRGVPVEPAEVTHDPDEDLI